MPRQVKAHSLTLQNACQKGHFYMLMVFIYNTFPLAANITKTVKSWNKDWKGGSAVKSTY